MTQLINLNTNQAFPTPEQMTQDSIMMYDILQEGINVNSVELEPAKEKPVPKKLSDLFLASRDSLRSRYYIENLDDRSDENYWFEAELHKVPLNERYNLVGSRISTTTHLPVIDIDNDFLRLIPSTTPGHYHLYIDYPVEHEMYSELLKILVAIGLVQVGYFKAFTKNRETFVRPPHVRKKKKS